MVTILDQNILGIKSDGEMNLIKKLVDNGELTKNFTLTFSGIMEFLGFKFEASKVVNDISLIHLPPLNVSNNLKAISEHLLKTDDYFLGKLEKKDVLFGLTSYMELGIARAQQEKIFSEKNRRGLARDLELDVYNSIIRNLQTESPKYQAQSFASKVMQSFSYYHNNIQDKRCLIKILSELIPISIEIDIPPTRTALRLIQKLGYENTNTSLKEDKENNEDEAMWHLLAGKLDNKNKRESITFVTRESGIEARILNLVPVLTNLSKVYKPDFRFLLEQYSGVLVTINADNTYNKLKIKDVLDLYL